MTLPVDLSVNPRSFGDASLQDILHSLQKLGVQRLELPLAASSELRRDEIDWQLAVTDDESLFEDLLGQLQSAECVVSVCAVQLESGAAGVSPEEWERVLGRVELLGARTVVCAVDDGVAVPELDELAERIRVLAESCSCRGLAMCLENRPYWCGHPVGMLQLWAAIDHAGCRLSFDTGALPYYHSGASVEIGLAKVCHAVGHVRLRDTPGEFGRWDFPALGYGGAVEFVRVWQLMRGCGFRGPYAIAVDGSASQPVRDVAACHEDLVRSLRTLRDCGFLDGTALPREASS